MSHTVSGVALEENPRVDPDTNSCGVAWKAWFCGNLEAINKEGDDSSLRREEDGVVVGEDRDQPQRENE